MKKLKPYLEKKLEQIPDKDAVEFIRGASASLTDGWLEKFIDYALKMSELLEKALSEQK